MLDGKREGRLEGLCNEQSVVFWGWAGREIAVMIFVGRASRAGERLFVDQPSCRTLVRLGRACPLKLPALSPRTIQGLGNSLVLRFILPRHLHLPLSLNQSKELRNSCEIMSEDHAPHLHILLHQSSNHIATVAVAQALRHKSTF